MFTSNVFASYSLNVGSGLSTERIGRYLISSLRRTFVDAIGAPSFVTGKSGSGAMRSTSGTAGCTPSVSGSPFQPSANLYASPNARWKL